MPKLDPFSNSLNSEIQMATVKMLYGSSLQFIVPHIHLRFSPMSKTLAIAFLFAFSMINSACQGQLVYDEATDGDLSGLFATPTPLTLGVGLNTITGTIGPNGNDGATNGNDADYFTFVLGPNESANSLTIIRDDPGSSFSAYTNASSFNGQTTGDIVGNGSLFSPAGLADGDVPSILGSGAHAFWIQETGGATGYTFSVNVVSTVPEPSSLLVLGIFGAAGLLRRRR